MSQDKEKTINLTLHEGDLSGVISIEDLGWKSGELYSAPRSSVEKLLVMEACKRRGVYLLTSQNKVYVGRLSDLEKQIAQHKAEKTWWSDVAILTTKNDSFSKQDVEYLEYSLIEKAQELDRSDCDNKKKGYPPKVGTLRKIFLQQYLDDALLHMQLIGINVFSKSKAVKRRTGSQVAKEAQGLEEKLVAGKKAKKEAIAFANAHGVKIGANSTYAVKQESKDEFWANPKIELLNKDWYLILNNNEKRELIILFVPAGSLQLNNGINNGLHVRTDKKELINLYIHARTLNDRISGTSFSKYLLKRLEY